MSDEALEIEAQRCEASHDLSGQHQCWKPPHGSAWHVCACGHKFHCTVQEAAGWRQAARERQETNWMLGVRKGGTE